MGEPCCNHANARAIQHLSRVFVHKMPSECVKHTNMCVSCSDLYRHVFGLLYPKRCDVDSLIIRYAKSVVSSLTKYRRESDLYNSEAGTCPWVYDNLFQCGKVNLRRCIPVLRFTSL